MPGRWLKKKGVKNPFRYRADGAVEIKLTRGKVAIIDAPDLPKIAAYRWNAQSCRPRFRRYWFASAHPPRSGSSAKPICMHRILTGVGPADLVNHMNNDRLDNRRANLRLCDRSLSGATRRKQDNPATSTYKGVSLHKSDLKWRARIMFEGSCKNLGSFASEVEAAQTYDAAATESFGGYARLNFPGEAA